MKTFNEWINDKGLKTITIKCRDYDDSLENLLRHIQKAGNVGHSFSIVVDPDGETKTFDWDGDGADCIRDIKASTE